jgi:hypothetical protein
MDGTYDTRTYDGTTTLGTDGQTVTNAEKEAGLFELAKCAARAKHHLHNVVFDESVEIDVVNEIKFSVITIALPLGRKYFILEMSIDTSRTISCLHQLIIFCILFIGKQFCSRRTRGAVG